MAEQISRRSNNVTSAPFDTPFETHIVRFGTGGLNLKDSLDAMEGWSRLTNIWHENEGEATARPGETVLATHGTGATCHTIRALRDPGAGSFTRFWGVGTTVQMGAIGATGVVSSGYSGRPLTFCPHRPTLSSDPWMFVGDSSKMAKIRSDGLALPIGLPAPAAVPTLGLASEYSRALVYCDDSDGTEAANWTPAPGKWTNGTATDTPDAAVDTEGPIEGSAIYLVTNPGTASTGGYDSWWGIPVTRDLTILNRIELPGDPDMPPDFPGELTTSDDDIFHIWMKTSHPQLMAEIRLYVVISETFDPLRLPGTGAPEGTADELVYANGDAYVKAFRPGDYIQFAQAKESQIDAAETARIYALRDKDSETRGFDDTRNSWEELRSQTDPARARSFQLGLGHQQWFGYGMLGSPLRRGDFQRIGSTPGRGWGTVTGVIIYVRTLPEASGAIAIGLDDVYITGGFGPDTSEPGLQPYEYRATHYDPRTGAESNGSEDLPTPATIDPLRRGVAVTPIAYDTDDPESSPMRQRIYRRGGSLIDDWFFCGENLEDGGVFIDIFSDTEIALAGALPTDHYEPVPTLTADGTTVLAQPCPALFGPLEGMLFACGDPYRPGHLYYSVVDEPDHWSAFGNVEVCPPSEELQHGGLLGHQGFVFSRQRLYFIYPNLGGAQGVTVSPGLCTRGLNLSRWAFCIGPMGMIFFVTEDGVFATNGGPEEWLSEAINPLFYGTAVNGLTPIDKSVGDALDLTVWENALYFQYQDTGGNRQVLVYSLLQKFWRHYVFGKQPACLQGLEEDVLLLGGRATGASYTHTGTSDDGAAISCTLRPGSFSGGRREEKLFGDIFLDADPALVPLSVQVFLNEETVSNAAIPVTSGDTGRQRFLLHAFGDSPQKAHSIACELRWTSDGAPPTLFQMGYAITLQPDLTNMRVTNWDDLNSPDEVWLTGVTLDCDTGGLEKTILIERDFGGVRTTVATFDVTSSNRHKFKFSWPAVPANMVRIRPDTGDCVPWLLYRADWIYVSEPPRISKWDVHFENKWDQYYTGLDLYCDTGGQEKRIEVYVDEVRLVNTLAGGLTYWPVVANGRRVVHLTLPWGRGHVFRFKAIDDFDGLLYTHRWHLQEEPSEQSNWNQNFSILGTHADKWLKAVIFECDTYGQNKSVQIEVDGTIAQTLTVNTTGRRIVQIALADQHLGRVWRMFPVDANPGRLYTAEPIFDEEPFCFDRWETQETNHRLPGWFYPLYAHITLKASQPVTLRTVMQHNQVGGVTVYDYVIPATGNQKQRRFLNGFHAGKGVLIKYILTSAAPFWLYRDETTVVIQPWGGYESITVQPFGNDDNDPARPMTHAILAAHGSGGAVAPGQAGE
jgi:hypothetical protein